MFEVGAVLQFFFRGEGEEVFADGELAVDLVLGEAEVGDVAGRFWSVVLSIRCSCGSGYKNPTLWTAWSSCLASFSLPPGTSNCERSKVTRSAQSTWIVVSWRVVSR